MGQWFWYFLVLWLVTLLFLSFFTLFVKNQLTKVESGEVNDRMNRYVRESFPSGLSFPAFKRGGGAITLQGLSFVRMVSGSEQVFFAGDKEDQHIDFRRLVEFNPASSGVWIDGPAQKKWTILSRKIGDSTYFQAGKKSDKSYGLYLKIKRLGLLAAASSFVLSILAACYLRYRSFSPIRKVTRALSTVSSSGGVIDLASSVDAHSDLQKLYSQINRLLEQNRQLIIEMQGSLDNVAHDLRTPMTRLRSVAEYALQAEPDQERYQEALSDCLEESDRVLSMLKIMMSVAEAESGTMQLDNSRLDLKVLLEDVISLYEYSADELAIHIQADLVDNVEVIGDKTRLSQVWANLLDNALKYSHEGGLVEIRLFQKNGEAVVSIGDDGMGISPSEMDRIWERLYRGDRSRTRPGLGLGLNFVKAVVEAHGGRVDVKSKLQEGSVFTVYLKAV